VKGNERKTYNDGKCIKIESRFDGHVARTDAENIHATSVIWVLTRSVFNMRTGGGSPSNGMKINRGNSLVPLADSSRR
jgi:hypothetical protein